MKDYFSETTKPTYPQQASETIQMNDEKLEIHVQLDFIKASLNPLEEAVSELERQLIPIIKPVLNTTPKPLEDTPVPKLFTPLGHELKDFGLRVGAIADEIISILHRLQI